MTKNKQGTFQTLFSGCKQDFLFFPKQIKHLVVTLSTLFTLGKLEKLPCTINLFFFFLDKKRQRYILITKKGDSLRTEGGHRPRPDSNTKELVNL